MYVASVDPVVVDADRVILWKQQNRYDNEQSINQLINDKNKRKIPRRIRIHAVDTFQNKFYGPKPTWGKVRYYNLDL